MLTADGIALALNELAEQLRGGRLTVSDGSQSASAPIDSVNVADGALTATATFGSDSANFEWSRRSVVAADGTVVDTQDEDHGRKAAGAEWDLEASIELAAG